MSPWLRHRASPRSKGGRIVWLIPTRSAWGNRQTMRVGLAPFRKLHCAARLPPLPTLFSTPPFYHSPCIVSGFCSSSFCVRVGPRHSSRGLLAARGGSRARASPDAQPLRRNSPLDPPSGGGCKVLASLDYSSRTFPPAVACFDRAPTRHPVCCGVLWPTTR